MRVKTIYPYYGMVLWLAAVMLVSCAPTDTSTTTMAVLGCIEGGPGIFTPEDVRCYLDQTDPAQVQRIDEETVALLAEPESNADWAGAAIIYHIPTISTLVLDQFGDADPQASIFSSRAGLAALSELGDNPELMAGLKQQLQLKWQTAPSNEPVIRLDTAWQDGSTTIFFIAVAGLEATDDRFYCPSQTWTIGDSIEEIAYECIAHEAGTPVNPFFFEAKTIKGSNEQPVQVALNGVPSNVVQVREGPVAQETLVYQAVLQQISYRLLIVRGETVPGLDEDSDPPLAGVEPSLLQNYLVVNKTPYSLRFLFQGSSAYFVQPAATIARDYLRGDDPQSACAQFRSDYPGLGGVATLSRIGISDDGTQALVHVLHECGSTNRQAAYYTLAETGDGWQVTNTFAAITDLPTLTPEMDYVNRASGCGDIFVYKSNRDRSEYVKVSIDARAFDLSTAPVTLELEAHPEAIWAWIDVYADSVEKLGENPYCNDVSQTAVPQSVWQAVSGTITVTSSAGAQTEPCTGELYQVNVLIEDVVFALGDETFHQPSLMFNDVQVGWCPG